MEVFRRRAQVSTVALQIYMWTSRVASLTHFYLVARRGNLLDSSHPPLTWLVCSLCAPPPQRPLFLNLTKASCCAAAPAARGDAAHQRGRRQDGVTEMAPSKGLQVAAP